MATKMSRQDSDPDMNLAGSVKNWLPGSGFVVHGYRSADPDLTEICTKINTLRPKMYFSSVLFGDDVSCELRHKELIVKSVNMTFGFDLCGYCQQRCKKASFN
jgi:hypothetical protein